MKSAQKSRIMWMRLRMAFAMRKSALAEVTASTGALIKCRWQDSNLRPTSSAESRSKSTELHRHSKNKGPASGFTDLRLLAFAFVLITLAIIANLRYNVKPILLAISQNCDIMNLWKIKGFVDLSGENIVKRWCDAADYDVWIAFVTHLKFLSGQLPNRWVRPWVGKLAGGKRNRKTGCAGLIELRFDVGNVEYRPLGYFSGKMEFTILFFAEERDGDFDPPNACQTAKERKALIDANKERAREFRL